MMKIRIERPKTGVDKDVRVWLDDHEVTSGVQDVQLSFAVGEPTSVTVKFLATVEVNTFDLDEWADRRRS